MAEGRNCNYGLTRCAYMPGAGCSVSFIPLKILFSCISLDEWGDYSWKRKETKTPCS